MKPASELLPLGPARRRRPGFDVARVRRDFPILNQCVFGKPLVYLDNAATSHKPRFVIDTISRYYERDNSNIHRGLHNLSERSTRAYEGARGRVQKFINAADSAEIVFVRGTTEGINLVAATWGRRHVGPGDEILITEMEHHSNIVPWQMLAEEKKAVLRVAPVNDRGELILERFETLLTERTRIVSVVHISNSLGTINPVRRIVEMAHARGACVVIDGAQAAPHRPVDVQEIGCDFYAFSGHKMYGPTGIGVLYGRKALLEAMPPYQGGGDMIASVTFEKTTYNAVPHKFEAGTPNIVGSIGLGAAIGYLAGIDLAQAAVYEDELLAHATEALASIQGVRLVGTAREKASVCAFVVEGVHPHDVGTILDQEGIAIRAGHHCTQPLMQRFGVPATARASLCFYNTHDEIEALARAVRKVQKVFA